MRGDEAGYKLGPGQTRAFVIEISQAPAARARREAAERERVGVGPHEY